MNSLIGLPLLLLAAALLWPLAVLRGGRPYLAFLAGEPQVVVAAAAAWLALGYWLLRRLSVTILLRASGDKVRIRDER
jgi:hypothetical protein